MRTMTLDKKFELGDDFYNLTTPGIAYLVVVSESNDAFAIWHIGQQVQWPMWIFHLAIGIASTIAFFCLLLCFCHVRTLYNQKKKKAKKQQADVDDEKRDNTSERMRKFKYNRGQNDEYDDGPGDAGLASNQQYGNVPDNDNSGMTEMGGVRSKMSKTGSIPLQDSMNMTGEGAGKKMGKTGFQKAGNQFDDIGEMSMKPNNYD